MTSTCAVVVAAGRSERFGGDLPKVLVPWRGRPLLAWTLDAFDRTSSVTTVVLVASPEVRAGWTACGRPGRKVVACVDGGATRQASVGAGLAAMPGDTGIVLVHDGARPFVTPALVGAVVEAATRHGAAVPILSIVDTVKRLQSNEGLVTGTVPRQDLGLAQTPQGFRVDVLRRARAHAEAAGLDLTDDAGLVEQALEAGHLDSSTRLAAVPGEATNVKITRPEDLPPPRARLRVGLGHDIHPLERGRAFVLGGVDLQAGLPAAERFGPAGHSDGDAVAHALVDAILGAAGLGDIGQHFPDTEAANAGRSSLEFLEAAVDLAARAGWTVSNVSVVVHLERPKVLPHAEAIRRSLAAVLRTDPDVVGLSAKRGEGLGDVGEGRAVVVDAVALLESPA